MIDKINKFKELNNKLTELIAERIELAREYYQEKMPKFVEGNIVIYMNNIYLINYLLVSHNSYGLRQHFDGDRMNYNYDNQIEKEYCCDINYRELNTTGKAKRNNGFWLHDRTHDSCEVICNVKDFERIAKENGIKNPKLNKIFILKLHNKIKENLVVSN